MRLRLVHARAANRFMRDILEGIAHEACALGADAAVVDDKFDPAPDVVHLVVPHEYFAVVEPRLWPHERTLGRTIALTVEHPGTPWFDISTTQASRCAAVVDINRDARAELRRRGVRAEAFQIGYTAAWDHWHGAATDRDIAIAYLGSTDPRRDAMLAEAGRWWADVRAHLMVPTVEPKPDDLADSLTAGGKFALLARTSVVVNAHRLDSRCLEWVRVVEAITNGAVVVSEHSADAAPLRPGEHFVSGRIETLGLLARGILDHPSELARLQRDGYEFLRQELPMRPSVERLLSMAERLARTPRTVPRHREVSDPPRPGAIPPGWPQQVSQIDVLGGSIRRIEQRLRALDGAVRRMTGGSPDTDREVVRTPSYDIARPRVSVITASYNPRGEVLDALASMAACHGPSFELLVQDDASTDDSAAAISAFLEQRPWLPATLHVAGANRGPSVTRNRLLARARGEFVFVLDADNGVYPAILERLVAALDDDPAASFAYAPIAAIRGSEFTRLVSARPWMPRQLRHGNYIDAMALVRTSVLRDAGGWSQEMDGWEDFHLWVRLAEAGHHAAFVPQVLSWYRTSAHSLSVQVATDHAGMWSRIRAAAPNLMSE